MQVRRSNGRGQETGRQMKATRIRTGPKVGFMELSRVEKVSWKLTKYTHVSYLD